MKKINSFKIGNHKIGPKNPVFVIAEISANHNQSFERAKKLVETACKLGVGAVKLQTHTPDTLTLDSKGEAFRIRTGPWKGKTLFDLYKQAYMPWEWQLKLKKISDKYGVPLFSTAYDETSVDFLEKMGVPAYKIASFEITDMELLKKVAKTGKPVIISRGMANFKEINEAISVLRANGASEIAVLHCVSSYPAEPEEMNLSTIPVLQETFGVVSGLSDHNLTNSVAIASVVLGACIIEKHFTLSRDDGGPDAGFSLEPKEFEELIKAIKEVKESIGKPSYGFGEKESENLVFRRSLFAIKDIKKGEEFTRENIRCIRPGYGLAPKFLPEILGHKTKKYIKRGTPLKRNLIS